MTASAVNSAQAPQAAAHSSRPYKPQEQRFHEDGERRAQALANRGPLRFTAAGRLAEDITAAYRAQGFYIFQGLLAPEELTELRAGVADMLDRAPTHRGARTDRHGRPALDQQFSRETYAWIRPLSDPVGGSSRNGGRHPVKMPEPTPGPDAPDEVIYMRFGRCQAMSAGLRLYGHPGLLAAAATLNGDDFVPFNDAIFLKQAGHGGSVAWHQDGMTHWHKPAWNEDIHGLNFQAQLHPTTLTNCLWLLPGSHKLGTLDIRAMVAANNGSVYLPGAVPVLCDAGDVVLMNRQLVHCSFANTGPDLRVSLTFGFHRREAVIGAPSAGLYSAARVATRSQVLPLAIDARSRHFPNEPRFRYQPFADREVDFEYCAMNRARILHNYNLLDLGI